MTRSDRLEPIAGLAKNREDSAAVGLGQARQRCEDQERRLTELKQFQREYIERFQALGQSGIDIQRVNEYRRFNDRLTEVIRQQQQMLDESRRQLELQTRAWSEASAKRRALDKSIDRFRGEEAVQVVRREQRDSDEHALRMRSLFEGYGP
jgi:flagellar protein FliJ